MFIDMLDMWEAQGFKLFGNRPQGIQSTIGTEEPLAALYSNLAIFIAGQYFHEPTPSQKARAENSLRSIRNRLRRMPIMRKPSRMPRGSGNYWYNYYFLNSDGSYCEDILETNTGAVLVVP